MKEIDVRKVQGNFLPGLLKQAEKLKVGEEVCVIQSFEPVPLYGAMEELGFSYTVSKINDDEFRVVFKRETKVGKESDMPFKPAAIVNLNTIDPELAGIGVDFWQHIWAKETPAIDTKTRLLLSLANGVGAGRMRQAVREFVKGYTIGITIEEFDEIFALFVWNQGIGFFASEIGTSTVFQAYKLVKRLEEKKLPREEIVKRLLDQFGESNPDVKVL